jgi:hypothetical protein
MSKIKSSDIVAEIQGSCPDQEILSGDAVALCRQLTLNSPGKLGDLECHRMHNKVVEDSLCKHSPPCAIGIGFGPVDAMRQLHDAYGPKSDFYLAVLGPRVAQDIFDGSPRRSLAMRMLVSRINGCYVRPKGRTLQKPHFSASCMDVRAPRYDCLTLHFHLLFRVISHEPGPLVWQFVVSQILQAPPELSNLAHTSPCHKPEQQCENNRPDQRDQDRVDETNQSTNHPNHNIHDRPVAATAHDFPRQPARDEPDDNPPKYEHASSCLEFTC